jgi:hypothetical protein
MALKIKTAIQLQEKLENDLAWRMQEIVQLRRVISTSSGIAERAILRAAIPILYSHWEGYIKNASCFYASYLSMSGLKYEDVLDCFMGISALEHVRTIDGLKKKVFASSAVLQKMFGIQQEKVALPLDGYIKNVGNLNFEIFAQVASLLGIDLTPYTTKKKLIDESLIDQRNHIAHGEYLEIDKEGYLGLSDDIISLMRSYKADIENAVALKSYMKV